MEKLKKLKKIIISRREEILLALEKDLGKSTEEGKLSEYIPVINELNLFISKGENWKKPKQVLSPFLFLGTKSYTIREPYGRVLVMSPWNYPFQLAFLPTIAAIASGNTVVLKPSEVSSHTAEIISKIAMEFNSEELKVVTGDSLVAQNLLKEKFDYIFFTGSSAVGKEVYKRAAEFLTPVTLELGGKSPAVIEEDANFEDAVEKIIWGKMFNCGQTCIAPDYVYLPKGRAEEFKKIAGWFISDLKDRSSKIINRRHWERINSLISGENIYFREELTPGWEERLQYPLTLVLNPDENSPIMNEEIFGPLLPIIEYTSLAEVYKKISYRPKPLALYIFRKNSKDLSSYGVSSGGLCINSTLFQTIDRALPFGGVGDSGIGSYHGKYSFNTFTHEKAVFEGSKIKTSTIKKFSKIIGKIKR